MARIHKVGLSAIPGIVDNRGGRPRYVYVIAEAGGDVAQPVKIGVAGNPNWRLIELQIGNPRPLNLIAAYWCETKILAHQLEEKAMRALSDHRLRGEWFNVAADEAVSAIEAIIGTQGE